DHLETHRLQRETELWRAIENEEFVLFYQPIRALASGEIVGAEALIRWQHPEEGLLAPGEFIAVAQDSGMIVPMGAWVKTMACKQGARWINNNGRKDFIVSVNFSARNFREPDFVERVGSTLAHTGLPARNLQIELTERALLRGMGRLNELRAMGVKIAVDDLGTGYASLEYLSRLEIDSFKIDRTFVGNIANHERNRAVVEAVLLMGERMGLRVIAEGIETEEELEILRALGCRYGQGFLLGRPMPASDFDKLLGG
ncbi:MAG TPA: EAL domain-containing protein, partial [Thermoanaerobaculia bacterium]|nr:EAL domain-containing protein [Thermoanaerobaculia bacterium]